MSSRYRLLLVNVPSLLRDIVLDAVAKQGHFEVIHFDASQQAAPLPGQPDVVLAGTMAEEDEVIVSALQSKWPSAQVLTLRHSNGNVALYETWRRRKRKESIALPEVLAELYDAAKQGREFSGDSVL